MEESGELPVDKNDVDVSRCPLHVSCDVGGTNYPRAGMWGTHPHVDSAVKLADVGCTHPRFN